MGVPRTGWVSCGAASCDRPDAPVIPDTDEAKRGHMLTDHAGLPGVLFLPAPPPRRKGRGKRTVVDLELP